MLYDLNIVLDDATSTVLTGLAGMLHFSLLMYFDKHIKYVYSNVARCIFSEMIKIKRFFSGRKAYSFFYRTARKKCWLKCQNHTILSFSLGCTMRFNIKYKLQKCLATFKKKKTFFWPKFAYKENYEQFNICNSIFEIKPSFANWFMFFKNQIFFDIRIEGNTLIVLLIFWIIELVRNVPFVVILIKRVLHCLLQCNGYWFKYL